MLSRPAVAFAGLPDDKGEAKKLRDNKNAELFVVFDEADANSRDPVQNNFQEITGSDRNVINLGESNFSIGFDLSFLRNFRTRLHERLCSYYVPACFYTAADHYRCDPGRYTRRVPVDGGDCEDVGFQPPATHSIKCKYPIDCDRLCNEL